MPIEIVDLNWRDRVSRREAENGTIEEQLGLEAAADGVSLAESMLLAFKREECDGQALRAHGVGHRPRLARRHHLVLEALEKNERARQSVHEVDWRPSAIDITTGRVRPEEAIEIPRLEFVRVARHHFDVSNAVVARASLEHLRVERQSRQRGIAASAVAAD